VYGLWRGLLVACPAGEIVGADCEESVKLLVEEEKKFAGEKREVFLCTLRCGAKLPQMAVARLTALHSDWVLTNLQTFTPHEHWVLGIASISFPTCVKTRTVHLSTLIAQNAHVARRS
jgi:hypothetical protein